MESGVWLKTAGCTENRIETVKKDELFLRFDFDGKKE